jgi:hypothetical protein
LIGVAAAAGAFGAAAMMSAATAPTARADDFTDVINAVDGDYGYALVDYSYRLNAVVVDPLQELLLGAAVSF